MSNLFGRMRYSLNYIRHANMNLLSKKRLYTSTDRCLRFLRRAPATCGHKEDESSLTFHCYWHGAFTNKQSLSIKSFLATQNLRRTQIWLWLDKMNGYDNFEDNPHLKPLLSKITVKSYNADLESLDTPLAGMPFIRERRDLPLRSDVFRILVLFKYGGCYFDLDVLFLRDLLDLSQIIGQKEFCYQWCSELYANSAILYLQKRSEISYYLVSKSAKIKSCHPKKLFAMEDGELKILMLPSAFFDPAWLHVEKKDISKLCPINKFGDFVEEIDSIAFGDTLQAVSDFFRGCFAYHWHNQWNVPWGKLSIAAYYEKTIDLALEYKYGMMRTEGPLRY